MQPDGIYEAGSNWVGKVSGYRTGLQAGEYELLIQLLNTSQGDAVISTQSQPLSIDSSGGFRSTNVEIGLPKSEGAYSVELTVRRKRMLPSFVASKSTMTRRVDLIAINSAAQPTRIKAWTGVAKIEPLESRWWSPLNWLSTISSVQPMMKLPTFAEPAKRPVSYGTQSQTRIDDQPCLVLGPNSWQSYPLQIEHSGNPHRVRVRVPRDRAQQLVISIRDFPR